MGCSTKPLPGNLISNGSFEMGHFVGGPKLASAESLSVGSTVITGWTTVNAEIAWDVGPIPRAGYGTLTAADGKYFLDLTGFHDSAPYGGVSQTIGTVVGQTYKMSFYIGSDAGYNNSYGGAFVLDPSVNVSVNGVHAFSASVPLDSLNQPDLWTLESFTFTATSNRTTVTLIGFTPGTHANPYIGLDDVVVEAMP